jgi:hypothetical protein
MTGGVPNVKFNRALPKPFQRPSISIGSREERRVWQEAYPEDIHPGDTIPGLGVVERRDTFDDGISSGFIFRRVGGSMFIVSSARQLAFIHPPRDTSAQYTTESLAGSLTVPAADPSSPTSEDE